MTNTQELRQKLAQKISILTPEAHKKFIEDAKAGAMERFRTEEELENNPPWSPTPGPQDVAYHTDAFETLYGGAAGGGKSDLVLGLARLKHRRSVIFRRTYPQLEESIIIRAMEFYGNTKHYNQSRHVWNLPDRRRIRFASLPDENSKINYQSAQFDFISFDELTQFTEGQYIYLFSRARTTDPNQRVRIVSCTNPGGDGNLWVMKRWAAWLDDSHPNRAEPGEIRWYRIPEGTDEEIECGPNDEGATSRTFIAAKLRDNPYIDKGYRARLMALPEPYRSQLLDGDWNVGLRDDAYQVIPREWVKRAMDNWDKWKKQGFPGLLTGIGADVAGGGEFGDDIIVAKCYDNIKIADLLSMPKGEEHLATMELSGALIKMLRENSGATVMIDSIGVGLGTLQRMQELGYTNAHGFVASYKTDMTDATRMIQFTNWRSAGWWLMREALDPANKFDICIPRNDRLYRELITPRWKSASNGRVKIEAKEDIKKRLGSSTDYADPIMQIIIGPLLLAERNAAQGLTETQQVVYNPVRIGEY